MSDNLKISAFIITKNEEKKIEDALKSIDFIDEIVVVDDYSDDRTLNICKKFGVKIFQNKFTGFKDQKSFAMSLTSNDWVLELDADERVSDELKDFLKNLKTEDVSGYDGFLFKRKTYFWGKWLRYGGSYPDYKLRLYNKKKGKWSEGNIHERFIVAGKTLKIPHDILHYQDADLNTLLQRTIRYSRMSAYDAFSQGKVAKWHHYTVRPIYTFFYRYFFRLGFLDGIQGFAISVIGAIGTFTKYMFLKELERGKETLLN